MKVYEQDGTIIECTVEEYVAYKSNKTDVVGVAPTEFLSKEQYDDATKEYYRQAWAGSKPKYYCSSIPRVVKDLVDLQRKVHAKRSEAFLMPTFGHGIVKKRQLSHKGRGGAYTPEEIELIRSRSIADCQRLLPHRSTQSIYCIRNRLGLGHSLKSPLDDRTKFLSKREQQYIQTGHTQKEAHIKAVKDYKALKTFAKQKVALHAK